MHESDAHVRQCRRKQRGTLLDCLRAHLIRLVDHGAHPIGEPARAAGIADAHDDLIAALLRNDDRLHRRAPGRQFVDDGDIQVRKRRHGERARNRRRRHDELVRKAPALLALLPQPQPLLDTQAMLLVDDHEREVGKSDAYLKERMRAHDESHFTCGEGRERDSAHPRALRPRHESDLQSERMKPVAKIAPVLLGEQLGRRHERRLQAAARRTRGRRSRDHGLAAADVTLQKPQHWAPGHEVGVNFLQSAQLRGRQLEGQRLQEARRKALAVIDHARRIALHRALHELQAQMMREQFLKGESPLRRMASGGKFGEAHFAWRPMHVHEGVFERRQPKRREDMLWNPVAHRGAVQFAQRLRDERAQASLRDALCSRIDRCQTLLERGGTGAQTAVLRMHHFKTQRSAANLAKAAYARTACQALLLREREIEEAQREKAGAIADARNQLTAFAVGDLGEIHLAFDRGARTGGERAEGRNLGAILVAQRQDKEQILHLRDAEARQTLGERRADPG